MLPIPQGFSVAGVFDMSQRTGSSPSGLATSQRTPPRLIRATASAPVTSPLIAAAPTSSVGVSALATVARSIRPDDLLVSGLVGRLIRGRSAAQHLGRVLRWPDPRFAQNLGRILGWAIRRRCPVVSAAPATRHRPRPAIGVALRARSSSPRATSPSPLSCPPGQPPCWYPVPSQRSCVAVSAPAVVSVVAISAEAVSAALATSAEALQPHRSARSRRYRWPRSSRSARIDLAVRWPRRGLVTEVSAVGYGVRRRGSNQ